MPLLGKSALNLDDSPAEKIELMSDGKVLKGMFASMRLLPKAITEKLTRPVKRKARKADDDETDESVELFFRQHIGLSLVDTVGVEWSFLDKGMVDLFAPFIPTMKAGAAVSLDGHWADSKFKDLFLQHHPQVVAIFLDAYKRLATLGAEAEKAEEEGKDEASPSTLSSS